MRGTRQSGTLARTHGEQPGLPRGRSGLPRRVVRAAQRDRLLRAVISAVADKGYADVTVADIVERARVSRNAFYDHFPDKEACFLIANDEGCELMFTRIREATRALGPDVPAVERLRAALRAYLEFLAAEPEFARTFLIDALAAGPDAREHFVAAQKRFATNGRAWYRRAEREHRSWPKLPDEVHAAIVGAVHELVVARVREGRTAELLQLEETVLQLHMAVFGGWPEG